MSVFCFAPKPIAIGYVSSQYRFELAEEIAGRRHVATIYCEPKISSLSVKRASALDGGSKLKPNEGDSGAPGFVSVPQKCPPHIGPSHAQQVCERRVAIAWQYRTKSNAGCSRRSASKRSNPAPSRNNVRY
jgi:hypothetical protein